METLREVLGLGLEPKELGVLQVCLRGIIQTATLEHSGQISIIPAQENRA